MNNQVQKMDNQQGGALAAFAQDNGGSLAVNVAKAELDQAIVTAKQYPRSLQAVQRQVFTLATLNERSAEQNVYALPRGGKPIRGASVRFAEILASAYGNCHVGSRVIHVDRIEKVVIAEGVFWDLETGLRRTAQVRRRITDKNGRLFNDDMIVVTGNAAGSIAMRNAILSAIPKALWEEAYLACEQVLAGSQKTVAERREELFKAFAAFGVKPELIFEKLEIEGESELTEDNFISMGAIYVAVRDGTDAIEDHFPALRGDAKGNGKSSGKDTRSTADKMNDLVDDGDDGKADAKKAKGKSKSKKKADKSDDKKDDAKDAPTDDGEDQGQPDDDPTPEPTEEEIEAAKDAGADARGKGRPKTAIPERFAGHKTLADAWREAWKAEDEASGG